MDLCRKVRFFSVDKFLPRESFSLDSSTLTQFAPSHANETLLLLAERPIRDISIFDTVPSAVPVSCDSLHLPLGPSAGGCRRGLRRKLGKDWSVISRLFLKKTIETAFRPRVVLSPDCFAVVGEEGGYDDRNVAEAIRVG